MLKDARNLNAQDARRTVRRLHSNWGRTYATQRKRISADTEGVSKAALDMVGEASNKRDICQAPQKVPQLPAAGAPLVSPFNEMAQVALLYLGDDIAAHNMGHYAKYSSLARALSQNSLQARCAHADSHSGGPSFG